MVCGIPTATVNLCKTGTMLDLPLVNLDLVKFKDHPRIIPTKKKKHPWKNQHPKHDYPTSSAVLEARSVIRKCYSILNYSTLSHILFDLSSPRLRYQDSRLASSMKLKSVPQLAQVGNQ